MDKVEERRSCQYCGEIYFMEELNEDGLCEYCAEDLDDDEDEDDEEA